MMSPSELPEPSSIPIHVPDASVACVGWTVGTFHSPWISENVVPVAYCPDQFNDAAAFCTPPTCGRGGVTNCGGSVWSCAEETECGCAHPPPDSVGADTASELLGRIDTAAAPCTPFALCAPAAETPASRPTATSVSAPSHLHQRNDCGMSASRVSSQEKEPQEPTADASSALSAATIVERRVALQDQRDFGACVVRASSRAAEEVACASRP